MRRPPGDMIKLSTRHRSRETVEIVCDINGVFATAIFDYERNKKIGGCEVFGDVGVIETYTPSIISDLLKRTTEWMAEKNGFVFKKEQIRKYTWIKPEQLHAIKNRMIGAIRAEETLTEVVVEIKHIKISGIDLTFRGIIDAIEYKRSVIWEVKCVDTLTDAHYIQLATYKFINLYNKEHEGWRYMLFNVKDNSIHELIISDSDLTKMIETLIRLKYHVDGVDEDSPFIAKHAIK